MKEETMVMIEEIIAEETEETITGEMKDIQDIGMTDMREGMIGQRGLEREM